MSQRTKLSALSGQYVQALRAPPVVILLLVVGFLGNALALHVLRRTRSRSNVGHVFMLRCLFATDCMMLACNLFLYATSLTHPDAITDRGACKFRVVLLFFGLCTCDVILVIAVERWVALTKPLFYRAYVSHRLLKQIMIMIWLGTLSVVLMTFFDIGIYWDEELSTCVCYRNAKKTLDVMYAYMIFSFGLFVGVVVVFTNSLVSNVLSTKDALFEKYNTMKVQVHSKNEWGCEANIREEMAFGWLTIFLCVVFASCWGPYVILIPLNRLIDNDTYMLPLNTTVDLLLMIHCVLDPFLYVLHQWVRVKSILLHSKGNEVIKRGFGTLQENFNSKNSEEFL